MIALVLEIIIALVVSYFAYSWKWWLVTLVFPIIISITNQAYKQPMTLTSQRRLTDGILMVMSIGYMISQIIIFQLNIGHWYGWLIGAVIGWIGMTFMAPGRWSHETN